MVPIKSLKPRRFQTLSTLPFATTLASHLLGLSRYLYTLVSNECLFQYYHAATVLDANTGKNAHIAPRVGPRGQDFNLQKPIQNRLV